MIHIPGRLRVSDEVVICFPLRSLCAFLFWLQLRQQVLERQTLAPAEKESGDARELRERERDSEDSDGLPPALGGLKDIYAHYFEVNHSSWESQHLRAR